MADVSQQASSDTTGKSDEWQTVKAKGKMLRNMFSSFAKSQPLTFLIRFRKENLDFLLTNYLNKTSVKSSAIPSI